MREIIETWQINNSINLYLLNAIADENLSAVSASKGRTVGEHFAHIHNVRLMWLKEGMPEILDTVEKIKKENIFKKNILEQLTKSGKAISGLLEKALQ